MKLSCWRPCLRWGRICLTTMLLTAFLSGCGFFGGKASKVGPAAAKTAHKYIGTPYKYGGRSPKGFDCSGLTYYIYDRHGVKIPPSSARQAKAGVPIKKNKLRPGDLVFFRSSPLGAVNHVGIYIGKGRFIHASSSGKRVIVSELDREYFKKNYHGARRY